MTTRLFVLTFAAFLPSLAAAQESKISADFRREGKELKQSCEWKGVKTVGSCMYGLITQNPVHMSVGSLAPGNGFALGVSFAERWTPNESWRITWSADAVRSPAGSWRSGFYMKLIRTPDLGVGVGVAPAGGGGTIRLETPAITVYDVYVQTISLRRVGFYGLGPDSLEANKTFFGEKQTLFGGSVTHPLSRVPGLKHLRPALQLSLTGRRLDQHSAPDEEAPSIEEVFSAATAPGLGETLNAVEFREAVRFKPSVANDGFRFNYLVAAHQFRGGDFSFNRWTFDLRHEVPLYHRVSSEDARDFNTPNECGVSAASPACPKVTWSRNLQGTIGFRALVSTSAASAGHQVPFYLQPTLGGADINGDPLLASFADYRFRGPHVIAFQESIEHSIWGPFGAFVMLEQGKVVTARGDLDFRHLVSSTTVGLTVRAGGLPLIKLGFSFGREGHHISGSMAPTLLGGSTRPSLF